MTTPSTYQRFHSICVFCGSADGLEPQFLHAASSMGALLAQRKIQLVYGGGKTGMMGAVADGALHMGGTVIGIVPENLNLPSLIHESLTHLEITPDMHSRKARMSALADAFIALPGGFGTLEELFETLTWAQIGLHQKPIGILNTGGYYDPLLDMVNQAISHGFIYSEHRALLIDAPAPEILLEKMERFISPVNLERWVNR
ncbi:MAG TPA: TIGR00730 family Rossman fold protein [Anaerolinea thermolimosa]|uniref:Cytokinin riboside 5'-monophosphate phosphoribohydrolase n=1 Tax=Anaerolinea thermolimosa TaxID=229919 RepID=A0A3D1JER6_9CHLR|nr:TIGR00730 family Rossman fold protein [Anaerolinea thermolimosa]GAP06208.1 TIGR00730 family protein [Anaerolinea thermolimosa]HCE16737.1 TIGR00730 family Rossman fold protein [Anaerolinea thermolimosa]